jgi:hypothetical protein
MEIQVDAYTGGSLSINHPIPPERAMCFTTREGAIAYPGDLYVDVRHREGIWWNVQPRWSWPPDIGDRVREAYPELRGRPIEESRPVLYRP